MGRILTVAAFLVACAAASGLNAGKEIKPLMGARNTANEPPQKIAAAGTTALVEVYAGDFISMHSHPLKNHPIKVFINTYDENQAQSMTTDDTGFLRLQAPVGAKIFFTCEAANDFHETTTAISTVPAEGLSGVMNRIVLQVPSNFIYGLFKLLIGRPAPADHCQTVVTITQYGKTYTDDPQGWPGVAATISPANYAIGEARPFYFGTMLNNKTDPLPNNRTTTSFDGGVLFPAIPLNTEADFVVGATYKNYGFTTSSLRCMKPGQFLNAAPNQGPRATSLITE